MVKSPLLFYQRYVNGLPRKDALKGKYPLRGVSPFGDGAIDIHEDGSFTCSATNTNGSAADFLTGLYPLLTEEGVHRAIEMESTPSEDLNTNMLKSSLHTFHKNTAARSYVTDHYGTPVNELALLPIFLDSSYQFLKHIEYSSTEHPITVTQWELETRQETIIGVPRPILQKSAPRIWFTENALDAAILQKVMGEPAYLRPNKTALQWNDYQQLCSGKKVIILMKSDYGDWEYSGNPLLETLLHGEMDVSVIYTDPMTDTQPFAGWVQNSANKEPFLQTVRDLANQSPVYYDKETYHEYIGRQTITDVYAPQDMHNGHLWYKLQSGEFVHSHPMNICSQEELLTNYGVKTDGSAYPGIKLTRDMVLNISTSNAQLTPKVTFQRIRKFIMDFVYMENDEMATLIALWIMGTYVYMLFPAYAYLHLLGEKDTGKTTLMEIIAQFGFNGMLQSQTTRAKVTEFIDRLGCAICLDEFESSSTGTGDEFTQMLKGGYKKSGSYSKMAGKGKSSLLNTYSGKVFGSIDLIGDEALASRVIPIRTKPVPFATKIDLWESDDSKIHERSSNIRLGCYSLGLYHHHPIRILYKKIPKVIKLSCGGELKARKRQLVAPMLAVARYVDMNGPSTVETEFLKAIEIAWYPENNIETSRKMELYKLLSKWSQDSEFSDYTEKDNMLWINNECWKGTPLADLLDGKAKTLTWFENLSGVIKKTVYLPSLSDSKSCTGFPLNLKVHKKTIQQLFRQKMAK